MTRAEFNQFITNTGKRPFWMLLGFKFRYRVQGDHVVLEHRLDKWEILWHEHLEDCVVCDNRIVHKKHARSINPAKVHP